MKSSQINPNRLGTLLKSAAFILLAALAPQCANAAATASDDACNDSPISSGGNGGTGFAAWTGVATGGGGFYTAGAITGESGCSSSWGMYPSGAATATAQRPFASSATLSVGQTITVDMANGGIDSGGSEGMSLYNSSGVAVFEFYYANGNSGWTISDSSGNTVSSVPYEGEPSAVRVQFTLTSSTTYSLTVQAPIGTTSLSAHTGTLISESPQAISQLRFFAFDTGSGNNLEVGQIGVSCPTPTVTTQPSSTTVNCGSTAIFIVASTTAASPAYQWQCGNGTTFTNVTTGTGATTASYTTVATTDSMNGYEYRCVVTDACGDTVNSTAATLTVTPPSSTITAPAAVCPSSTGNTASVPTASGGTYTWTITGGTITDGSGTSSITFSANASGNVVLNCTVTSSTGCSSGGSQNTTISIGSPISTITAPSSVCANSTGNAASVPTASGGTYTWTITGGTITAGSGTSSITFTAGTSGNVVLNCTIVSSAGCSSGGSQNQTVTINTEPVITGQPQAVAVCNGSSASFSVTNTGANTTYQWIAGYWAESWSFNNASNALGNSTTTAGGGTHGINSGNGTAWELFSPQTSTSTNIATRTLPITLAAGTTFQIDMDNGYLNSPSQEGFDLVNASGNVVWGFSFTGGASDYVIADSVNQTTAVGFTGNGLRINFSLTTPTNYTVTIIAPLSAPVTNTYTGIVQEPAGGTNITGLLLFASGNNSGQGASNGNLFFNNLIVGNYTDNAGNYTTWSGDASGTALSNGGNISGATSSNLVINPVAATNAVNYDAILSDPCGSVTSSVAALTVNPLPLAVIYAPMAICPSTSGTATVSTNAGATYSWSITNGTITAGQSGTTVTFTAGASGANVGLDCTVTSASGCSSSAAQVNVPLSATVSAAGPISGPTMVCSNETLVGYSITNVTGATGYTWTVPAGASITAGANTTNITVNFGTASGTGYVIVTPTGACASGAPSTNTVTISPASVGGTVTASASSICSGGTVTVTNTGYTGSIQWQTATNGGSFSSISGATSATYTTPALLNTTSSNITYSFYAVVTSGACSTANSTTNTVTVSPTAVGGTATAAVSNLLSGLSTTITLSGYTGAIQWQSSPDDLTFTNIPGATASTYATPTLTQTTYYQAVVSSGPCSPADSTVATVAVSTAPGITTGPASTSVCSGATANFTVTASGTALSYAWYQHANAGWGSTWTVTNETGGTIFLGSSTDNNNGAPNCNSFSSTGDINTPSGDSWGLYGGATGEQVARTFPAALTNGQIFQIDMDNGFVNTGLSVGFSLHNSSNALLFSFYFTGGGTDYGYYDGTGAHTTSVPYTVNGLQITVMVGAGSPASYSLLITSCGDSPVEYAGTFATTGAPDSVLLYNNNTSGAGANYNLYFNRLIAGLAYDNADNYTNLGNWSGFDLGDAAPIAGATNSSYATATGNNGDVYYAMAYNDIGAAVSSAATLTVNPLPTVTIAPASTNLCDGSSALLTATGAATYGWSPATGLSATTGSSVTANPTATTTYTVTGTNASGCTSTATVTVTVNPLPTASVNSATVCAGSPATLTATTSASSPSYLWSPGGATTASITVSPASTTTYTVVVTDGTTGCANGASGTVTVNPLPTITLGASPSVGHGTTSASLPYTGTTGTPNQYSITFDAAAHSAGFADVTPLNLPGSPITITVPATASPQTYHGTLSVWNTTTGCASDGAAFTVSVVPANPAVTLSSSENPSGYKDSVSFAVNLPADATGSVAFASTNGPISTNTVSGGVATSLSITNLPRGTNVITATYSGDTNYLGVTVSLNQIVTNHPPVASLTTVTCTEGMSAEIALSDMATNWSDPDGDTVELTSINLTTTNGVALFPINLTTNLDGSYVIAANAYLGYRNPTNVMNDQFSYSISDGQGGTNIGYVDIIISTNVITGQATGVIATGGGPVTVNFAGIIGYSYSVQRSTNLLDWVTVWTTNAPAGGLFNFTDNFGDLGGNPGSAYYRLSWAP